MERRLYSGLLCSLNSAKTAEGKQKGMQSRDKTIVVHVIPSPVRFQTSKLEIWRWGLES